MYSFHLFLTSSASTRSLQLLCFNVLIFRRNVPLIFPIFLKRSLVIPLLLFSSSFMHCLLKKTLSSLLAILWNSAFNWMYLSLSSGFPGGSDGKESTCNAGDPGLIPGLGRSPGEGNGYPFQYSCLKNSMDRGHWWATVHRVTKDMTEWLTLK